jgi:hypothetical protein
MGAAARRRRPRSSRASQPTRRTRCDINIRNKEQANYNARNTELSISNESWVAGTLRCKVRPTVRIKPPSQITPPFHQECGNCFGSFLQASLGHFFPAPLRKERGTAALRESGPQNWAKPSGPPKKPCSRAGRKSMDLRITTRNEKKWNPPPADLLAIKVHKLGWPKISQ